MATVALHTRLKAGSEQEYDRVHAVIPAELDAALRAAGVVSWRIWRDGQDIFHVVEAADFAAMRAELAGLPVNVVWQERINALLEVVDDYSAGNEGLPLVWELP